jgi:protein-disulfide isomerase
MSKVAKPLIVIVVAVSLAAGAAYSLSRAEGPSPLRKVANMLGIGAAQSESPATSQTATLTPGGGHFRGPESARLTLVEFGDYQCPSCGAYHPVVQELLRRFPKDLRLEFHHYPLISIHPNAMAASLAVEAAGEQGKYWEMHDLVFDHQEEWSRSPNPEPNFLALANQIGLDPNKFMQSMRSPATQDRVLQDVVRARDAHVEAVPTFFIDGQMVDRPASLNEFMNVITTRLQGATGGTSSANPNASGERAQATK